MSGIKSKAKVGSRTTDRVTKPASTKLPKRENSEPAPVKRASQLHEPAPKGIGSATGRTVRTDYRAQRAAKHGKKYINVLVAEELQREVRPRMMLRKLTWETLIEGLLQKWLAKNPQFHP